MDPPPNAALLQTLLLAVCWRCLQEVLERLQKDRHAAGYSVSFIHSLLVVILILAVDGVDSSCLLREAEDNRPAQQAILSISVAYFLHDTLKTGWTGWRVIMLAHHLGGLLFLSMPLFTGRYGSSTLQALLLLEASNPFYHGRRILRFFGYRGLPYVLLELFYVCTFYYFRFVRGILLSLDAYINQDSLSSFYVLGALFFQSVSFIFMAYIFHYLLNRYVHPTVRKMSSWTADKLFLESESEIDLHIE